MLRIHFTGEDLARLRMAPGPDTLWETILSFHRLRDRRGASVFGEWRQETRGRLSGETRWLSAVVPCRGYFPDFLTPPHGPHSLDAGLMRIRETGPERLDAELSRLPGGRPTTGWAAALADGCTTQLGRLADALAAYHQAAVSPYWAHIQARVDADRAARGRALLDGGASELLDSLPPMLRWRAPVLEADYPVDRELHLNGRGLLLQPSFFCRRTPVALHDPKLPPVLVYPVTHTQAPYESPPGPGRTTSLGRLVGHTRSSVLMAIGNGCTTSELARRAGVSLASASQHAGVLRDAGLLVTLRHGNSVLHTLTPLGSALLCGGTPRVPRPRRPSQAAQSSIPERSTPATM
ncbi:winged helix-turn-helix domain-containing protein [Streptomyces sp. MAG02]|nr:winged helix-turn-helix domain-containing protein [Streptomyces sp. MAG02]